MALSPGDRLGPFEVVAVIGEGGMGRVYRARDTKLQRDVAIKVLPDSVAGDAERVARFEREARTLAALNHPHIAQIYGTEQSGTTHALVMELVDGEDLARRIARGPIEWREAQPVARQIAEALEAAHEQGIVHRDLKPANIKLTPDGVVKVLDFGLAKVLDQGSGIGEPGSAHLANSPTITSPAAITQGAVILGTAAYMSPEQSKGRTADKRSDVWAFGCVLYEMLTGKRAFPGDDVMETLAAVVRAEPDFGALPVSVPHEIHALLERCLTKDRRARVPEIAVARYVLDAAGTASGSTTTLASRRVWPWAIAAIAGTIAIATVAIPRFVSPTAAPIPVVRSTLEIPGAATTGFATIAVSQDGTMVAYPSTQGRMLLKRLSETEARPLPGTEGAANPFFSPDGESLGFFADGKLKTISIEGGVARDLAEAPSGRGGTWGRDGTIVFAPGAQSGLFKVSANGGAVTVLTQVAANERSHRWPHLLPDGRHVLVTIQRVGQLYDDALIAAVPIDGGPPRAIVEAGSGPQYAHSGHLIYGKSGALMAMSFDPVAARSLGAATPVLGDARTNALNGALPMGVSSNGLLVYLPGVNTGAEMTLITGERNGPSQLILGGRMFNDTLKLSPNGRSVAVSIFDGQSDIWLIDLGTRGLRRLTSGAGSKTTPVWKPDGSQLYYTSNTGGVTRTVTRAVDGSGTENDVTPNAFFPTSISPDGRSLVGRAIIRTSLDVVAVDVATGKYTAIVAGPANETDPSFSPDGHFVAYQSDESGTDEVYVQEFPSGSRWQVTTGGGTQPRWTLGGRELVYRRSSTIYVVPVTQPFSAGAPRAVFSAPNIVAFDVTADGKRIVAAQREEDPDNQHLILVSGSFEELKAKVRPAR